MELSKQYIIGFTGTRNGMTEEQKHSVRKLIYMHDHAYAEAHNITEVFGLHGDCEGADEDFHNLCREHVFIRDVWCRPCTLDNYRAHTDALVIAEPVRPMERNRIIAGTSHIMIACPPNGTLGNMNEHRIKRGSGTWATIGFRERAEKDFYVVYPDGTSTYVHYN